MPRASELPVRTKNTLDKRRAVVGTPRAGGLDGPSSIQEENLGVQTLDLDLLLFSRLEI